MNRVMVFPNNKMKALTLSYDDGVDDDIRLIEIMRKNGLKGTFNINTGCFSAEGTVFPKNAFHRRMTEAQAYKLYENNGMEVAVHTCTHPHLENLPLNEVTYEVLQDKMNIEKATGRICRGMAYPYGTTNDEVVEVLKKCGILYSRTTQATRYFGIPENWLRLPSTCHHNDPELMKLAKNFVESNPVHGVQLFYLWGHSYEFERDDNWNVIEKFAEYIGNRDDIWYATNSEIFEYIEAYKQLRTSCDGHIIYNPTVATLYFMIKDTKYEIAPGKTVRV